uniref:excisionase family DNA-binding protein n=1 Tax=Bacteroides cellulosilyticus TaxID=246787 RepID=UPI0040260775
MKAGNLLTTQEAADYIGLKVSYLHKLMMKRVIPFYKPNGKLCFFDRDDLDKWLTRVRVPSQAEIDQQVQELLAQRNANK